MPIFHQPHNSKGNYSYNIFVYDTIDYGLHFHKNYEIIYVIKGRIDCSVNGHAATLERGDFAVCLSNEIHSVRSVGEARVWIGVFSDDFIPDLRKKLTGNTGELFAFRCSDYLMNYLNENLIMRSPQDIFVIKSCLYALCSEYLTKVSLTERNDKHTSIINSVVDYMEKNYSNVITLSMLAEAMGYEYCYFSKMFYRIFSMSFNDYLNTYRFNKACELLTDTDIPITQVSFKSGFQSIRSFNGTFKRLAGVSPSEYRRAVPPAK